MSQADAVSTRPLPPGVSEAGFAARGRRLHRRPRRRQGAHLRRRPARVPRPVPARHLGRLHRLGGRHADHGGGDPGGAARRQRAQGAAVDARHRAQQRLRRARAARARLGDREPAQHEPRPRDQRGARLRGRRAGRALVRPLRGDQGRRPPADALDRRPRLGRRHRQHARPRRHLHALRRRHGDAVRDGGRARRTGRSCAPAWARCRATGPGTSTSAVWGRRPTSSSCSRTSGSSRRWASG